MQLKKIKIGTKNNTRTTLGIIKKNLQGGELPRELFFTTRQKTKIGNAFANNKLMDIKFSKSQLSKIIQLGRFLGAFLGKLAIILIKIGVPLAKNVLATLATMASASANRGCHSKKKMHRSGVVRTSKGMNLVNSNKNMNEFIRIIVLLEISDALLDGVSETVKHVNNKKVDVLVCYLEV